MCNGSKSDVKITQFGRLRVPVIPSLYNIVQSGGRLPRTVKVVGCRNATTVVGQNQTTVYLLLRLLILLIVL